MRILMIGSGAIGRRHIYNLKELLSKPEFLFLRDGAREDEFSLEIGAKVIGSFDAALDLHPDVAVIATPSVQHLDALQVLLPAQIPCYIEKPVVVNEEQAQTLELLLKSVPQLPPTLVGCNLRYLPSLKRLRELLHVGAIGCPVRASLQVGQWLPDWRPTQNYRSSYSVDPARGGGVVLDLVHELDATRWLFGDFEKLHAVGGQYSKLEIEAEDSVAVLLGRSGGPAVSIGLDYVCRRPIRRYEIIGDEGSLYWDLKEQRLEIIREECVESVECGVNGFDMTQTYISAMAELLSAINSSLRIEQNILEGMRTTQLALNINKQLRYAYHC